MQILVRLTQALAAGSLLVSASAATAQQASSTIIFEDVRVFDGKSDALSGPTNVVVRDGKVAVTARPVKGKPEK